VIIGWVGMVLGAAGGLTLCRLLEKYKFIRLPGDIYFIDTLPVRVEAGDVAAVLLSVLVISVLATIYPAVKAARLRPVEAIRNANETDDRVGATAPAPPAGPPASRALPQGRETLRRRAALRVRATPPGGRR